MVCKIFIVGIFLKMWFILLMDYNLHNGETDLGEHKNTKIISDNFYSLFYSELTSIFPCVSCKSITHSFSEELPIVTAKTMGNKKGLLWLKNLKKSGKII